MIILNWREDCRVDFPLIDSEHRHLLGLINEFHDEYARGGKHQQLLLVVNRVVREWGRSARPTPASRGGTTPGRPYLARHERVR